MAEMPSGKTVGRLGGRAARRNATRCRAQMLAMSEACFFNLTGVGREKSAGWTFDLVRPFRGRFSAPCRCLSKVCVQRKQILSRKDR
jgi:hypothetical protein